MAMIVNLLFTLLMAVLPPCQSEDSNNCAWDAQSQGNKVGTSFVNVGGFTITDNR